MNNITVTSLQIKYTNAVRQYKVIIETIELGMFATTTKSIRIIESLKHDGPEEHKQENLIRMVLEDNLVKVKHIKIKL
jgi:hypothetical protein